MSKMEAISEKILEKFQEEKSVRRTRIGKNFRLENMYENISGRKLNRKLESVKKF